MSGRNGDGVVVAAMLDIACTSAAAKVWYFRDGEFTLAPPGIQGIVYRLYFLLQGRVRRYVAFESAKMQCRLGIYEACQKEDCFQHRFHLKKNNSLILLAVGVLFENRLDVCLHLLDGERGVAAFWLCLLVRTQFSSKGR